jgi:hypothetical protein
VIFPDIHVLYPELVHPLHYSPSYRLPLLKVTSKVFDVPYSYLYGNYINHVHPPLPSSFTLPSH